MEEVNTEVKTLTQEDISKYLESDDGRKYIQPKLDNHFTKSLETWKQNNLNKIIEEEITKKFPEETPEQKKLRELESKLSQYENENKREKLKSKALTIATNKGLPIDLIDNLIGADEQSTLQNIEKFEQVFTQSLNRVVEEKFKDGGRKPEQGKPTKSDVEKLQDELEKATTNQERIKIKQKLSKLKGD